MGDPVTDKIQKLIEDNRAEIEALFPAGNSVDRLWYGLKEAIADNPKLKECRLDTILSAVKTAAFLGLEVHPDMEQVWLIPRKGVCNLDMGYRGAKILVLNTGVVASFSTFVVYKEDEFSISLGSVPKISHLPHEGRRDPQTYTGVYSVIEYTNGGREVFYLSREQVDEGHRSRSQRKDDDAWKASPDRMAFKTMILHAYNSLPRSSFNRMPLMRGEYETAFHDMPPFAGEPVEAPVPEGAPPGPLVEPSPPAPSVEPPREPASNEVKNQAITRSQALSQIQEQFRRIGVAVAERMDARKLMLRFFFRLPSLDPDALTVEQLLDYCRYLQGIHDTSEWDSLYIRAQDWDSGLIPF